MMAVAQQSATAATINFFIFLIVLVVVCLLDYAGLDAGLGGRLQLFEKFVTAKPWGAPRPTPQLAKSKSEQLMK
jgi:hypothetical protein